MATTSRRRNGRPRPAGQGQRATGPFDPVQLYVQEHVINPHVLLLGQPGTGKSARAKCVVARLLRSGGEAVHVGIVDIKGEYAALAQALGLDHVRLYPGGPHRLNPLDAGLWAGRDWTVTAERRQAILAGLCATSLARGLSTAEHRALAAVAQRLASSPAHRQPVLFDAFRLLAEPTAEMIAWTPSDAEAGERTEQGDVAAPAELVDAARRVGHVLGRLLDRELRGCFDATTTVGAGGAGPGVVVDLSALPAGLSSLPLAVLGAMAWIESAGEAAPGASNTVVGQPPRRYNVVDEVWTVMVREQASSYVESWLDRAAGDGVAGILVAHRLHDLRRVGDDDKTLAKRARAFAAAFGTRLVFRQSIDDVELAGAALGLVADEAAALTYLGLGQALEDVRCKEIAGASGGPVQYDIGTDEWAFCDDPHTLAV